MEVTTARGYKDTHEKLIKLPSGAVFKIRKLSAYDFIKDGEVPQFIGEIRNKIKDVDKSKIMDTLSAKETKETMTFMSGIICNGVVEPRVVDKPIRECSDDEISVLQIDDIDKPVLMVEIVKFSQATKKDADVIEKFPEDKDGSICRPGCTALRPTTTPSDRM